MKKGIIQIFFGNFIFLVFGVLNNFILPKYLSVSSYALLKTYILYISYAGLLGLGYCEGMFLKYGGKTVAESKEMGWGNNIRTYLFFQIIMNALIFLIGILFKSVLLLLFAVGVFTTNILNYFKNYSTAVGEFKAYSISTSIEKIFVFVLNASLIFIFKFDNYILYVVVLIFVSIVEIFYFIIKLNRSQKGLFNGNIKYMELSSCIGMGIILLLGNSVTSIFVGIDQWFVKFLMSNTAFAMYAFAVSMERIIVLFITPITTVLYNFFCKKREGIQLKFVQEAIVLWGFAILAMVFPLNEVVRLFIPSYLDSLDIIGYLFCGQAFSCIINGVYVSILKAHKQQNKLLKQMILMTLISIILDFIAYYAVGTMAGLAFATLLIKIIWFIVCQIECKEYKYSFFANLGISLFTLCFVFCTRLNNSIIGCLIYVLLFLIISLSFMRGSFYRLISEIKSLPMHFLLRNDND